MPKPHAADFMADKTPLQLYRERVAKLDRAKERAREWLVSMQKFCDHDRTVFNPDPAGDTSESYHECLDCGKHIY